MALTTGEKLSAEQLYRQLETAACCVLYPSETDAPVNVFLWDVSERGALSLDALIETFGLPHDDVIAEVPPEDFFEGVTELYDWQTEEERRMTEHFRTMKQLFLDNVSDPKHYWVGEHTVHVFLWGRTHDGHYVGLRTYIVET